EAGKAREVLGPRQRAVDAGRTDLERVGPGDRILDVEQRRDGAADLRAIGDRQGAPVAALDHDLQRAVRTPDEGDAHDLVSCRSERRGNQPFDGCRLVLAHQSSTLAFAPFLPGVQKKAGRWPTFFLAVLSSADRTLFRAPYIGKRTANRKDFSMLRAGARGARSVGTRAVFRPPAPCAGSVFRASRAAARASPRDRSPATR